ncbi:hypothetical protein NG798_26530, partial [Ancylothrix sp. C2]|nr:hypothetical protein [Ancylothrix sp. D3o]
TPETLKKEFDAGHLNGQVIADVTLKGNYSTMKVEINPQTISFPQEWTRRRDIEPPQDDKFNSSVEKLGREIAHSMFGREDLTTKVNTTLLKDGEPVSVPAYQLTFDYLKHRDVKAFLDKNSIPHLEVNPNNPEINTETARGYRVVRIPCECMENDPKFENVKKALNAKLIDSASANPEISSPYHQKLAETKPITPEFVKLIKSSFPEHKPGKIEELPQTIKKESLSSKRFTPLPTVPAHKGKPNFAEFSRKPEPQPQPQPEPTPIVGTITPPKELAAKLRGGRLNAEGAGVLSTAADAGTQEPVTPTATQTVTPTPNAAVSVTKLSTQKPRLGNSPPAPTATAKSTIPPAPTPPPTSLASTPTPAETAKSTRTQNTMATPASQESPTPPPAPSHSKPASQTTTPAPTNTLSPNQPTTPAPTNTQITANTETTPEPKTTEPPAYQQKPWENMLTSLALNALKKEGQEIIPGINHASFFQGRLSAFNYTDPATGKDTIKITSNASNDTIYHKCRGEAPIVENLTNSQKQYLSALYQHFSQQLEGSISR